jgi:long-chain acyl-CoA synthetase
MNLSEQLRQIIQLDAAAPAVEFEQRWWSWGDLWETWKNLDAALQQSHIADQAPIGVVLRNRPECVASIVAIVGSGRCVVTISPLLADEEMSNELNRLEVAAVVAPDIDWERPGFEDAVRARGSLGLGLGRIAGQVSRRTEGGLPRLLRPGIAIEMLTSGTTGPPKRIPLPYENLARSIEALAHYGPGDKSADRARLRPAVTIVFAPLSHISGSWGVIESVAAGRRLALLEQFKVDAWLDLVRRHRPRFASLPPTCIRMVLDSDATKEDLASLKAVRAGTAPLDPIVAQEFEDRFGVPVLIVYGATEFAGAVVGWTLRDHAEFHSSKRGSAGRAHPGIMLRIVAEDSPTVLGPNEVGLLEVKGAQLEGIGSEEWNRTQDLASIDQDGFVWIQGRNDDVIMRGGFKVDTTKVASIVERHPGVRAASIVGIPDRRLGQVPVAIVESFADGERKSVTTEELLAWLRRALTPYEVPVQVLFIEKLPRNASLKINKKALQKFVLDTMAKAYE